MSLEGRVAIVTGAGSGLGEAIASEMAKRGASVAVLDINEEAAKSVAANIAAEGGTAVGVGCDVTDSESLDSAVSQSVSSLGALAIMVNNAGVLDGYQNVDEMDETRSVALSQGSGGLRQVSQAPRSGFTFPS